VSTSLSPSPPSTLASSGFLSLRGSSWIVPGALISIISVWSYSETAAYEEASSFSSN